MKITTNNPVIVDDVKVDSADMYLSADGDSNEDTYNAGGIKVTTINPVIIDDTNVSPSEYYSNVPGDEITNDSKKVDNTKDKSPQSEPSVKEKLDRKQKRKEFWNNAKGKWEKISNSPAAQFALQQLQDYIIKKQGGASQDFSAPSSDAKKPETPTEQPMSTTTKVLLGVGGALVLGLILYAVFSSDSKGKKTKK